LRHVILVVSGSRKIITGRSAQEYAKSGALWIGKDKAHVNKSGYFVLNSEDRCQKCSPTSKCSTVLLSVLRAAPRSARSRPSKVSPSGLTANDMQLNVEGNRRARDKADYYDISHVVPPILCPETQGPKRDLVEAELIRILAEMTNVAEGDACPPKAIDKIWSESVCEFGASPYFKKLNSRKASDLEVSMVRHLLDEYLHL
jgi:hypothetical protein